MTTTRCWFATLLLAWLPACGSAPATPEQRAQEERRLLAPFLAEREVGCGELLVELTGNLYAYVGQPAVDPARHVKSKETGDGYVDTVFTNQTGDPSAAFTLTIGEAQKWTGASGGFVLGKQTRFKVVHQVRIRVYEDRRAFLLNATAGGDVLVVKEAANERPREVAKFAIVDGVLHKQ
jgi:hypothetical protein